MNYRCFFTLFRRETDFLRREMRPEQVLSSSVDFTESDLRLCDQLRTESQTAEGQHEAEGPIP